MMKGEDEIRDICDKVDVSNPSKYPSMKYEDGVREALEWVLGDIPDEEFIDNF